MKQNENKTGFSYSKQQNGNNIVEMFQSQNLLLVRQRWLYLFNVLKLTATYCLHMILLHYITFSQQCSVPTADLDNRIIYLISLLLKSELALTAQIVNVFIRLLLYLYASPKATVIFLKTCVCSAVNTGFPCYSRGFCSLKNREYQNPYFKPKKAKID